MKAGFLAGVNKYELRETEKPVISKGEALLKVEACAFCGSDAHDASNPQPPRIPGHEFSGVIMEISGTTKLFKINDRVVIDPVMRCMKCPNCKKGQDHLCSHMAVIGCQTPGGFAEYVKVPIANLHKLPKNLSFELATLADPLAVALHASDLAGGVKGKKFIIFGAGTIGLLLMQVLKKKGAKEIAIIDLIQSHLDIAKELVPSCTIINASKDPNYEAVKTKRFDVCVELAGGRAPTLVRAIDYAVSGGLILMIAQRAPTEINCQSLLFGEKRLQGVFGQTSKNFKSALKMLGDNAINGTKVITEVFHLAEIEKAFQRVLEPDSVKVVVKP